MGISELRDWLAKAPVGTTVPASAMLQLLDELDAEPAAPASVLPAEVADHLDAITWRERLWLVPAETRLGTSEVLEALQRSRSWLYSHLSEDKGANRLPHRKLDAELVFTAGEVRAWLRDNEEVVAGGRMQSTSAERRLQVLPWRP